MKNINKIIVVLVVATTMVACNNKRKPQVQYMPDMYVSVPYNPNGTDAPYKEGEVNLQPVPGTIKRGGVAAYDIENTNEGYEKSKGLTNPLPINQENMNNGKAMYGIYCAVCHGTKGDGNGILNQRDKFSGIPNYKDRDINTGTIYHVIMYGKNLMGSYASQLTPTERWQVVMYVEKLKNELK